LRSDGYNNQYGSFDFNLDLSDPSALSDPFSNILPIIGNFALYDLELTADGQLKVYYSETGTLKGYVSKEDYVSFTIDWLIYTPDNVSAVPAPPASSMFIFGLLLMGSIRLFKRSN